MVFSSYPFIFGFLPITLLGFIISSRFGIQAAKYWLCLTSIVFYGWWYIGWIPVLLASIVLNYGIGWLIINRANRGLSANGLLMFGVTIDLLAIFYFKYLFAVLQFFGLDVHWSSMGALPLGISFFTFTQIAFLVDISQGFAERYTPLNYFLFVTFFPHLIAGPIVHHRDLMPQFEEGKNYRFQPTEVAIGLSIFCIGLAKKTLIADTVGHFSETLLVGGRLDWKVAWVGIFAYSMQLYFDFSGYSDMAIGLARLFGIKFPINFDSPYKATSIIDFWQRWHITLTRFLTAYTYNPFAVVLVRRRAAAGLSTSKRASKTVPGFLELIALPTLSTMLLAGIWHGAGLVFIIFGVLHGFYISVNHAWRTFGPKYEPRNDKLLGQIYIILSGLLVYGCVLLAQIFFRADSVGAALSILANMTNVPDLTGLTCWPWSSSQCVQPVILQAPDMPMRELAFLAATMAIAWFAPNTQEIMTSYEPGLNLGARRRLPPFLAAIDSPGWALAFGLVLFLGLYCIRDGQPFIYFQF